MLNILEAQSKMRQALKENLLMYLADDEIPVSKRWEVFTHSETQYVLDETDLGLDSKIINTYFNYVELDGMGLNVHYEYTYEDVLEKLLTYADEDFNYRVRLGKDVEDIDDLEYELKRLILNNGYYFVEV